MLGHTNILNKGVVNGAEQSVAPDKPVNAALYQHYLKDRSWPQCEINYAASTRSLFW